MNCCCSFSAAATASSRALILSAMSRDSPARSAAGMRFNGCCSVSARRSSSVARSELSGVGSFFREEKKSVTLNSPRPAPPGQPRALRLGSRASTFFSGGSAYPVTHSAYRLDQLLAVAGIDFLAQGVDVDVDDIGREVERVLPDPSLDLGPVNDFASPAQQQLEQRAFPSGQPDDLAFAQDLARFRIVGQVGEGQRSGRRRFRAARQRAQPGEQLPEGEGLDQIVVGARVQPLDLVLHGVARGQHQDLRLDALGPELAAKLEAVAGAGQEQIQNQQIVGSRLDAGERGIRVSGHFDGIALLRQALLQELGDLLLVLDDENLHAESCPAGGAPASRSVFIREKRSATPAPTAKPPAKPETLPLVAIDTRAPAATQSKSRARETSAGGTSRRLTDPLRR